MAGESTKGKEVCKCTFYDTCDPTLIIIVVVPSAHMRKYPTILSLASNGNAGIFSGRDLVLRSDVKADETAPREFEPQDQCARSHLKKRA